MLLFNRFARKTHSLINGGTGKWLRAFSLPAHTFLEMPALSPTMSQGKIASWTAKVGENVGAGDVYCEIETDKATVAYEAQEDGILAKILRSNPEEDLPVGTIIGVLVDEQSDVAAFANFTVEGAASAPAAEPVAASTPTPEPVAAAPPTPEATSREPSIQFRHGQREAAAAAASSSDGRIKASPLARSLAVENGVDLRKVVGTGPGGRIVADDVRAAAAAAAAAPPTPEAVATPTPAAKPAAPTPRVSVEGVPYVDVFDIPPRPMGGKTEDVPVSSMRKIIGQRLTESKMSIPHYYVTVECELDAMMKIRSRLNSMLEKDGVKISVNDFVIKASGYALQKVPETNMMWQGSTLRKNDFVDISVAVDVGSGLITPIVRNVEAKGLATVSKEVKAFVKKAKENKLVPSDYQGGTFTISNMGMMGVQSFTAIINPPQSCIVAVSSASKVLKPADNEKGFRTATVMNITLSSDHRVVDGATAARWCNAFREAIENPELLMC